MGFFRRNEETLNEQLLREAGLGRQRVESAPVRLPAPAPEPAVGLLVAKAPGIAGRQVQFVALPTGDLIVETEQGDGDLGPLADAVERNVPPPYRAICTREHDDRWQIVAERLHVRELHYDGVDEVELEEDGRIGHASRIDGDFWEVEAHPL